MNFKCNTLVLDFDNTLYDWVDQWYKTFSVMLSEISRISGIPEKDLKPTIREIHRKHHTSEYSFLIEEIPQIALSNRDETLKKYADAILAFKSTREKCLTLYPGVYDTLVELKNRGYKLVVFTESQMFYSKMRFKRFGLDGLIDNIYTSSERDEADLEYINQVRVHPSSYYSLDKTIEKSIRFGKLKPSPDILLQIISEVGTSIESSVYVGDSEYKDVLMANQARVPVVWAKYGVAVDRPAYELLREVSHWSDEDIEREKEIRKNATDLRSDLVLESGFHEILAHFPKAAI
jgi:phosphoglycolate phosphatase